MRFVAVVVVKVFYFIALLCAILGAYVLTQSLGSDANAIQAGSIHSLGIGLAVVPYCICRGLEKVLLLEE